MSQGKHGRFQMVDVNGAFSILEDISLDIWPLGETHLIKIRNYLFRPPLPFQEQGSSFGQSSNSISHFKGVKLISITIRLLFRWPRNIFEVSESSAWSTTSPTYCKIDDESPEWTSALLFIWEQGDINNHINRNQTYFSWCTSVERNIVKTGSDSYKYDHHDYQIVGRG